VALTAVCAKINVPIFSIKQPETFQIATSVPTPQPSTLVGALAYCLGVQRGIGLKAQEIARGTVVAARAKLVSEATSINPVILRRFRVLDKGLEDKDLERGYYALRAGDFDAFRKIMEGLTDALYREYLFRSTLKCAWILKAHLESKMLYLLQRLGDTESLVNVVEAWSTDCRPLLVDNVSTDYPFAVTPDLIDAIRGSYTTVKMCDEARELKLFYVPCKREVKSTPTGVKYFVYAPAKVDVRLKEAREVFAVGEEYVVRG